MDRNPKLYQALSRVRWSLSARRAWIEMVCFNVIDHSAHVALRKESVDRNNAVKSWVFCSVSRSPQGERG